MRKAIIAGIVLLMTVPAYAGGSVHIGDNNVTNNKPKAEATATGIGVGTGIANSENNNLNVNGNTNRNLNRNANLNSNRNSNTNRNRNNNTNIQGQNQGQLQGQMQGQEQRQDQDQRQSQTANANNNNTNQQSQNLTDNSRHEVTGNYDQSQSMTGSNNANQTTTQEVTFEQAKNLPGMVYSPGVDLRSPDLMLNAEHRMIQAALDEIKATSGKNYTDSYKYKDDGVTAIVAHNDTEATVHVFPSGSSKGITPAVLEIVAHKAARKIEVTSLSLTQTYVSIENHSNGFGAQASPAGSISDAGAGSVGGIGALVTGNRGRTSQRVRIELVYSGIISAVQE